MASEYKEVKRGTLKLGALVSLTDLEFFALRARKLNVTTVDFDEKTQTLSFTQPVDTGTVPQA